MKRWIPLALICTLATVPCAYAAVGGSIAPSSATSQTMLGRTYTAPVATPVKLRSATTPAKRVALDVPANERERYLRKGPARTAKSAAISAPLSSIGRRQVGVVFDAPSTTARSTWTRVADGYVTHIEISSQGAEGIRAQLQLPASLREGELRMVARVTDDAERIPLSASNDGRIWTNFTEGNTQIVEIFAPQISVGQDILVLAVVHFDESILRGDRPSEQGQTKAGTCNVDVACSSGDAALDLAIAERKKSVARMNFTVAGGAFLCTGTLLMNSAFPSPLFLTANHCVQTQDEASSLQTVWFRENAVCGATDPSTGTPTVGQINLGGGADLLFTNAMVDSTLLRLRLPPPSGTTFSGWDPSLLSLNDSVVSISHPTGAPMKYALGRNNAIDASGAVTDEPTLRLSGFPLDMYAVSFTRGIIEGGSSGSGLFTRSGNQLLLRGVLSNSTLRNGTALSCSNLNETVNYGRFEVFHPQILSFLTNQAPPVDDHPDQPTGNARRLPLNGSVAASINRPGDLDVFRIDITESGWLHVASTGGNDLIATLLEADGGNVQDARGSNVANDDGEISNNEFAISRLMSPGTYYVSVGHFEPAATTANGYQIGTKFTSATDNYTSLWWVGDAESGWGINVNHQGNILFASMFNYEAAGLGTQNPGMWLVATATRVGTNADYVGDLLRVTGPAFNASPFPPITAANSTRVGNLRLDFVSPSLGNLTYDVSGAGTGGTGTTVTKRIVRQTFGTLPNCGFSGTDRSYTNNFQDLWWNPAESGWGINFTHQYGSVETIFASMFTYEAGAGNTNKGLWTVATLPKTGERAINVGTTAQPSFRLERTFSGDLLRVTGSAFNAVPFIPLNAATNVTKVGTMRAVFTEGNKATLTYDINGQAVTKAIQRQVFGDLRPDCRR